MHHLMIPYKTYSDNTVDQNTAIVKRIAVSQYLLRSSIWWQSYQHLGAYKNMAMPASSSTIETKLWTSP